jgi:hypothetical protein
MKNTIQHLLCIFVVACSLNAFAQATDVTLCNLTLNTTVTHASAPQAHDGSVTANLTGATAPVNYLWSTGASDSSISNLGTGYYCVTVSDYLLCTATACASVGAPGCDSFALSMNFYGSPYPNQNIAYVNNVTGHAPFTYLWSTGATTDSISNLPDGHYCVTVTDAIGCSLVPCAGNVIPNGIEEETIAGGAKLYPNPVNNALTVEIAEQQNAFLVLNSLDGRVLRTYNLNKGTNTITTEGLPEGMYVYAIAISVTQQRMRGKVLVVH